MKQTEIRGVILLGGECMTDDFRPLSFETPKPLFPIAGKPLIYHHLDKMVQTKRIKEIILVGLYKRELFQQTIYEFKEKHGVIIKYIQEKEPHGTGGWLSLIEESFNILVLYFDNYFEENLSSLLDQFHSEKQKALMMIKKMPENTNFNRYGCISFNQENRKVVHYVEKPESFISEYVSCGAFLLNGAFFKTAIEKNKKKLEDQIKRHSETGDVFVYETKKKWGQIKSCFSVLKASEVYQMDTIKINPSVLLKENVFIGKNVFIEKGCIIEEGVYINNAIILENTHIKKHSFIKDSVIGHDCVIGNWCRVEGGGLTKKEEKGLSIVGNNVKLLNKKIVYNSTILPYRSLNESTFNEIII